MALFAAGLRGNRLSERGGFSLSKWPTFGLLIGVLLLAFALRLWGLDGKGLWQDEIFTAAIASPDNSVTEVVTIPLYNTALPAPPLYFLITHLLLSLVDNDFVLRLPALAFGVLGVASIYPLGARLFGKGEGLIGAFLLAIAPLHVRYSQDARFYTLLVFLSVLSVYALYRAVLLRERTWFVVFTIASVLNIYNHLLAFLVLGAEVIFVLGVWAWASFGRHRKNGGVSAAASESRRPGDKGTMLVFGLSLAIIALSYAPMIPHLWRGISGTKGLGVAGTGWVADSALLVSAVDSWGLGSGWRMPVLLVPFVLGVIASARSQRRALWMACCWIVMPLGVLLVVPAGHGFRPRYVLFMLPLYLILAARGLTGLANFLDVRLARSEGRLGWACTLTLVGVVGLISAPALGEYYREDRADWRAVSTLVARLITPGDVIVSPGPFPQVVMPRYEDSLEEESFIIGGSERYFDREESSEGGVWFVGPAREKMAAIDADLTERVGLFVKVVFEVDDQSTASGRALKLAPVMYDDLWVLYVSENLQPGDAVGRYHEALQVVPKSVAASIHASLGDLHRSSGELEEAIAEYQQAVALNERAPAPHLGLALAYQAQGRQDLYETEWSIYQELGTH
jgi:mannosyltransferase